MRSAGGRELAISYEIVPPDYGTVSRFPAPTTATSNNPLLRAVKIGRLEKYEGKRLCDRKKEDNDFTRRINKTGRFLIVSYISFPFYISIFLHSIIHRLTRFLKNRTSSKSENNSSDF